MATSDTLGIGEGADIDQPLAGAELALDHPVERAAGDDLLDPLGHHAGAVRVFLRLASFFLGGHPLLDPFFMVADRLRAHR